MVDKIILNFQRKNYFGILTPLSTNNKEMIQSSKNFMQVELFNQKRVESLLYSQNIEFNSNDYIYILARALQIHTEGDMNLKLNLEQCIHKLQLTKKVLVTVYAYNVACTEYLNHKYSMKR